MTRSDALEFEIAGRVVRVTSPDKVYFADAGVTKADLVRYYLALEAPVMRALGGRPVLLQRYPEGAGGPNFFQKRVPKGAPEWLRTVELSTPNGTRSNALVIDDLAHVAWAVNLGCLGFHAWPARADDLRWADQLRIDLDPMPGLDFADLRLAAHRTREVLAEVGISSWVKTSGHRGIHGYVPLHTRWDSMQVRAAAVALARELRAPPSSRDDVGLVEGRAGATGLRRLQPERAAQDRVRRVVGPSRPALVSMPLNWDDLDHSQPEDWTVERAPCVTWPSRATRVVDRRYPTGPESAARSGTTGTGPRACSMPRGHPCTPSSPTNRPGSRRAERGTRRDVTSCLVLGPRVVGIPLGRRARRIRGIGPGDTEALRNCQ
ncbi:MAG: ATP-dependent DNA ligase [Ilumatobacteraceae bacterium]